MDQEAGFSGSLCADRPSSPLSSRSSTPFHFPFPPLATALFDNDAPSRLLSLLQHQSMLTEESLRCRALLDESRGLYLLGKDGFKLNHFLADDMMKRKNIFGEGAFGCRSLREEELRCRSLFSKEARDDRCKNLDETVRCGVCFATFPSAWLLEQHTTLQHLPLGQLPDDKPFICEQCGQSYRYRSAYVKHREQNHRARLPADKLFTCDVCGMQFRYLKSFKKHRLNHALERLHGKSDMFATEITDPSARMLYMMRAGMSSKSTATVQTVTENSSDQVSSSNEAIQSEVDLTTSKDKHDMDAKDIESGPSEVITDRISECDQDDTIDSISFETHNAKEAPVETKSKSVSKADSSISDNTQETTILRKILRPSSEDGVEINETSCSNKLADSSIEQRPHDSLLSNMLLSDSNNAVTEVMRSAPDASLMNLNVQEASILNFLRVDAAERQRERRFACPFCGKCVRSKENLKLHVRKHTGERPFVCLFCGRAFGGKSDLTRHLRIHTGERPYHCEACGKCFARADYLSKHLTTHIHNTPR